TPYGNDSSVFATNMKSSTFTMGGTYDTAATGTPRVKFQGHEGDTFAMIRQPEGTGSGKPQQSFSAILTNYKESNPPGGDIQWPADFQVSGDIDDTDQT